MTAKRYLSTVLVSECWCSVFSDSNFAGFTSSISFSWLMELLLQLLIKMPDLIIDLEVQA